MNIQVILASTRKGRMGERVAKWVAAEAAKEADFQVELLDLAEYDLPFFDEAISPRYNRDRQPVAPAVKWLDKLGQADGYIIVTPEYNHSIPASIKNALDYVDYQMVKKPVAIVSYGSVGGARSAEHLKGIIVESKAAVVPEAVTLLGRQGDYLDESGQVIAGTEIMYGAPGTLPVTLTELAWWTKTLKAGRDAK